jgi:hypothetical protein
MDWFLFFQLILLKVIYASEWYKLLAYDYDLQWFQLI